MTDLVRIGFTADTRQLTTADRDLTRLTQTTGKLDGGMSALTKTIGLVGAAFAALGVTSLVRSFAGATDTITDLNSRLLNVTKSTEAAEAAMASITQTARRTFSSLTDTAEAFLANATTLTELGFATERQLELSEALNNALVISGTKGQAAAQVMDALSRSFAIGELRGQNFNSVIARGGRVVEALADGLGVTTLELRRLAEDGMLTTEVMFEALTSQAEKLRREADEMPATIGDGMLIISNAVQSATARFDELTGASGAVSERLVAIGDAIDSVNMEALTRAVGAAAAVIALGATPALYRFSAALAVTTAAKIKATTAATALGAAWRFMLGPVGLAITAIGVATFAFSTYSEEAQSAAAASAELKTEVDRLTMSIDGMSRAQAQSLAIKITERLADIDKEIKSLEHLTETRRMLAQTPPDELEAFAEFLGVSAVNAENLSNAATHSEARLEALREESKRLGVSMNELQTIINSVNQAQRETVTATDETNDAFIGLVRSLKMQELQLRLTADEYELIEARMRAIATGATPEMIKQIEAQVKSLQNLRNAYKSIDDMLDGGLFGFGPQREQEIAETFDFMEESIKRIDAAFADAWRNVDRGFKGLTQGLLNGFKQLLAEMAHAALTKPILNSLMQSIGGGAMGSGAGAAAINPVTGAIAAGALITVAAIDRFNARDEERMRQFTAEYRQSMQGVGTVLGDMNAKSQSIDGGIAALERINADILGANRNLYSAMVRLSSSIGGLAASVARGMGGSLGGGDFQGGSGRSRLVDLAVGGVGGQLLTMLPGVGNIAEGIIGTISKAIYSKKVSLQDTGILIAAQSLADVMTTGMIDAMEYQQIRTTRRTLGIKRSSSSQQLSEMDDLLQAQFAQVFVSAGDALREASGVFGVAFDDFANRLQVKAGELSLMGLEGDALERELQAWFSSTIDGWAVTLLSGTDALIDFQRVGEGAFETMVRVAGETQYFAQMMDAVGVEFELTGLAAVYASQNIAELAGGFDNLSQSLAVYYDRFFSEQEKLELQMAQLGVAFGDVGLALPATREEFRAIIDALDLSTEAGQELFAALIQLAPAMDGYLSALEREAETKQRAMAQAEAAAQRLADALQRDLVNAMNSAMSAVSRAIEAQRTKLQEQQRLAEQGVSNAEQALRAAFGAESDRIISASNERIGQMQTEISLMGSAAQASRAYASELEGLVNRLNSAVGSMGVQSVALQMQRRQAAQAEISAALAAAQRGDFRRAMGLDLSAVSSSAGLFGSAEDMAFDVARTQNELAQISGLAGVRKTAAERSADAAERTIDMLQRSIDQEKRNAEAQLAALDEQLDGVLGIDRTVLSIDKAIEKYNQALYDLQEGNFDDQLKKLDEQLDYAQRQLDAALGIDSSVMSVEDAISGLAGAIDAYNAQIAESLAKAQEQSRKASEAVQDDKVKRAEENARIIEELQKLREEQKAADEAIAKHTRKTADTLERLDRGGIDIRSFEEIL